MSDSSKNNSPRGLLARAALYRDTRNLNPRSSGFAGSLPNRAACGCI
ncbi:MAG: hypothetical protein ABL861_10475 [Nitrosomonas sp.]